MSSDGSAAFIFTKEPSGVAAVFRADLAMTTQVLTRVGEIALTSEVGPKANLITAADATGSRVIVRSYQFGYVMDGASGATLVDIIRATPRRFAVPLMIQGEALCASPDGLTLVTASESRGAARFTMAVGRAAG